MLRRVSRIRLQPPIHNATRPSNVNNLRPTARAYQHRGGPQYKRFGNSGGGNGFASLLMRWAARPTFYRDVGVLTAGGAGVYVYNLEEVPVSHRRRFNIISPTLEAYIGQNTMAEIQEQYKGQFLPERDPRVQQVKKVLERLIPYAAKAGLTDVDWEVFVIDSPEENAFVIPGGKVFVFTGILPACRSEDGIAAVLGHEIAHVVAHHTAERLSQSPLVLLGSIALMSFDLSFMSSMFLLNIFLSWPSSRKHEAEADYIGLMMMAEGCYRPEAAMEFWTRMERSGQGSPPQILSTHPSHHNRGEKIREWLPKAYEMQETSECHTMMDYADQFASTFAQRPRW